MRTALACSLVALAAPAMAQTNWIVDINNGPGADFTQIQSAIDAATAGDIIEVRPGNYSAISLAKAISIQGGPGVLIDQSGIPIATPAITVSGIAAGQVASIYGISTTTPLSLTGFGGVIASSPGRVHIEDCDFFSMGLIVSDSQPWLADVFANGMRIVNSTAVLNECTSITVNGGLFRVPAVDLETSTLIANRCTFRGHDDQSIRTTAGPAIDSMASTMFITDDGTGSVSSGAQTTPISAIVGTGDLTIDPGVIVNGSGGGTPFEPGINVVSRTVPSLRALGAPLGGNVQIDLFSPEGDSYFLLAGLPATPVPFAPFGGHFSIGTIIILAATGVQGPSQRATLSVPVANDPGFLGAVVGWQALSGDVNSGPLYLSNPDAYIHRR